MYFKKTTINDPQVSEQLPFNFSTRGSGTGWVWLFDHFLIKSIQTHENGSFTKVPRLHPPENVQKVKSPKKTPATCPCNTLCAAEFLTFSPRRTRVRAAVKETPRRRLRDTIRSLRNGHLKLRSWQWAIMRLKTAYDQTNLATWARSKVNIGQAPDCIVCQCRFWLRSPNLIYIYIYVYKCISCKLYLNIRKPSFFVFRHKLIH